MTSDRSPGNADRPAGEVAKPAGPDLRALREARGVTLREIYERTRVTVVNLEAIETGQFHRLPSPAYAKTFIKAYADAVGIDGKMIQEAYGRYLQSLNVGKEQEKDPERNRRKGKRKRFLVWTVLLTIIAGAALLALFLRYDIDPDILRTESVKPSSQTTDAATVEAAKPIGTLVPAAQTDPATPEAKAEGTPVLTGQNPAPAGRDLQTGIQAGPAAPPATVPGQPVSPATRQTAEPG